MTGSSLMSAELPGDSLDIYRFDHVSQVVPDRDAQVELLTGLFGFRPIQTWEHEGAAGARLAVPGSWGHHWEVIAPTASDSPYQAFLDEKGGRPGLHHAAFEVADVDVAAASLAAKGIKPSVFAGEWLEASL